LQETVAVPEPVTLLGVIAPQVNPVGTVSVSVTTPTKPFCAVIVMVEVAEVPTETAAGEEAAIVKSTKLKVAVVE
jgi:glycine cleavage system H lipoate-binding protein